MTRFILDTNLYIRAARDAVANAELEGFSTAHAPFLLFHSVVAQELLAGARDPRSEQRLRQQLLEPFERRNRVITPSHDAWKRAGTVLAHLVTTRVVSANGVTRSLINDCLLAASIREHGAVLVTANVADFQRIAGVLRFRFVGPWPSA